MNEADWNPASGTGDLWGDSPTQDLDTDLKRMGAPSEVGKNAEEPAGGCILSFRI